MFSRIVSPERTLQGSYFRSDEKMTKYYISNTKGSFEKVDFGGDKQDTPTSVDTVQEVKRPSATPLPKSTTP